MSVRKYKTATFGKICKVIELFSENCYRISTRKAVRPSKDVLLNEVRENGYSAIGRKYGVSDNAIRNW